MDEAVKAFNANHYLRRAKLALDYEMISTEVYDEVVKCITEAVDYIEHLIAEQKPKPVEPIDWRNFEDIEGLVLDIENGVINWQGENYYARSDKDVPTEAAIDPRPYDYADGRLRELALSFATQRLQHAPESQRTTIQLAGDSTIQLAEDFLAFLKGQR